MTVKYVLMHKNTPVAELEMDENTGHILKVPETYAAEHLPVGVGFKKGATERVDLNDWWINRSIPASRSGLRNVLETLGIATPSALLTRCYGLSLSDQYWIKPENSDVSWSNVNFFENPFSDDIGDILFGKPSSKRNFDFFSPDNTSNGNLKKRWKIVDEKRCLIKGGSKPFQQQPYNEVIASAIMQRLDIPHIDYELIWDEDAPYCICDDFITAETDLVSAWQIMLTVKQPNDISRYQHYINCCSGIGINDIVHALDQMITLDYIIANEDRHLNNFGLIRNAETLQWIGAAPVFDSGSSLGYELTPAQIRGNAAVECKPFKKHHKAQLELVTSFDWLDFSKLDDIGDEISEILSDERAALFLGPDRAAAVAEAVEKRIDDVHDMAMDMHGGMANDNTEDDVEEDIAQSYEPRL